MIINAFQECDYEKRFARIVYKQEEEITMQESQMSFRPSNDKRRILLIEDEFINQEILKMHLEGSYDVILAGTGKEAIDLICSQYETLSLILLDLNLPDYSGLDILRQVKADSRYTRLPVIVMTSDSEAEVECLTLGAIDFIPKPYPQQKVVLARVLRTIELTEDRDILRWTERDQLTGLYNKEFFKRYASQLDLHHRDYPADAIVLNINHFHIINDRYGRAYGDEILRKIAEKTLEIVEKNGGIVCRSEADTFLIYCPHCTEYDWILETVLAGLNTDGQSENRIRLRMGVYSNVDKELDIERRFDRAKLAAEGVKGSITKAIGLYDSSMYEAELLCEQLIEDFPAAIREHQFQVYYQPKFDVRPNEPILDSAEALVRWAHPKLGMVSPGMFIPLFENNGLIQTLDQYVWAEAARQVSKWKERFQICVPVSVNVSRIDLFDPELVEKLVQIVKANGLNYEELQLEITESAYTENADQIIETVKKLREVGFRIEMDDFGSGYSSLNMLSTLPVDALKLDMQFIRNAFRERKDTRLLEVMIQLAASFEVPTIAEGVETAEQMFTLKMMGCDIVQGYYFSRPLPAEDFEAFIAVQKEHDPHVKKKKTRSRRDKYTYDALHDSLTGLYNNSAFEILFHDADHDHIAVLIADIDDYAAIKKNRGRVYANDMVCRVTDVLKSSFRSVDHICRLKEDEFVVIMTRVTSSQKELVFSKIECVNHALLEGTEDLLPITLSVGVAFSDREQPDGDVFQDADTALSRMREIRQTGYAVY